VGNVGAYADNVNVFFAVFGSLTETGIRKKRLAAGGIFGVHLAAMHQMGFKRLKGLDFR
jgi:hypothetical protein